MRLAGHVRASQAAPELSAHCQESGTSFTPYIMEECGAFNLAEEKRLIRKVDLRLIPLLCILYLMKKLDESNVRVASPMAAELPQARQKAKSQADVEYLRFPTRVS